MNTITHAGESHDFATVNELFALPLVAKYRTDPQVSHFGQGDGQLVAFKLIEGTPVMCVIGALKDPVVLPKTLQSSQGAKP